jgi:RNA polymerase sigma-54 factor
MEEPEETFYRYIRATEKDPLFQRLIAIPRKDKWVVRLQRLPSSSWQTEMLGFREELSADTGSLDVESLLGENKDLLPVIQSLGIESFEKYFLYNEVMLPSETVAAECGIDLSTVERINELINDLSIRSEFYSPSGRQGNSARRYARIATIDLSDPNCFTIRYIAPRFAQGKYVIHYDNLNHLIKEGYFSDEEIASVERLLQRLEIINARKTTLHQLVTLITEVQGKYLSTGDSRYLRPFTQKAAAEMIRVDESMVSRAVFFRSIVIPSGREVELQSFFPSRKDCCKTILHAMLDQEQRHLTDRQAARMLEEEYGIVISRRTIALCRKEAGIPSSEKRSE